MRLFTLLPVLWLPLVFGGCDADSGTADAFETVDAIDITDAVLTSQDVNCASYVEAYRADATDLAENRAYEGALTIDTDGATCTFTSNAIPNHDFNDAGSFATRVSAQTQVYTITATPDFAAARTALSLDYDNAVLLNGVKVDLLAAGCYGVGNGHAGCHDMDTPWRYDPMGTVHFGTDAHNAHTQPDGTYHYHGNPKALFDDADGAAPSPVIGFAADGFPIFGTYFRDDTGTVRKATSSYQLKTGTRPSGPGGVYDGTFVDDYAYVEGAGDLDACNGMIVNEAYGYYVTDGYPHMLGCFTGTPDASFRKR
ncbi:MAG: YHYH protein [Bacteroidota bacterium]